MYIAQTVARKKNIKLKKCRIKKSIKCSKAINVLARKIAQLYDI